MLLFYIIIIIINFNILAAAFEMALEDASRVGQQSSVSDTGLLNLQLCNFSLCGDGTNIIVFYVGKGQGSSKLAKEMTKVK